MFKQRRLTMLLSNSIIAVTEFRKNPFMLDGVDVMAVMKNNKPEYYTITPERLAQLLNSEAVSKKAIQHILNETVEAIDINNIGR